MEHSLRRRSARQLGGEKSSRLASGKRVAHTRARLSNIHLFSQADATPHLPAASDHDADVRSLRTRRRQVHIGLSRPTSKPNSRNRPTHGSRALASPRLASFELSEMSRNKCTTGATRRRAARKTTTTTMSGPFQHRTHATGCNTRFAPLLTLAPRASRNG